jgi:hypothetical protein
MPDHYTNYHEIVRVVEGFENCTTSKEEFTHFSHLTVATCYLRNSSADEAFHKMCFGLLRFLDHLGVGRGKYNEQLTRRWIMLVAEVIEHTNPDASLVEVTNLVLDRLGGFKIGADHHDQKN